MVLDLDSSRVGHSSINPVRQIDYSLKVSGRIIDKIGMLSGIQHYLRPSDSNLKDVLQLKTGEHLYCRILKVFLTVDHRRNHSDADWDKVLDSMVQSYHSYIKFPHTAGECRARHSRKLIKLSRACFRKQFLLVKLNTFSDLHQGWRESVTSSAFSTALYY